MPTIENDTLALRVGHDGGDVRLTDKRRKCEWVLAAPHRHVRASDNQQPVPLGPGTAAQRNGSISVTHTTPAGAIRYEWVLRDDHVEVRFSTDAADVESVPLPGAMRPERGSCELTVPLYQGALIRPGGTPWQLTCGHGGHTNFTLSMGAVLADCGALVITHDSPANWQATIGEGSEGLYLFFEHQRCPVDGWRDAAVRMYPIDRDVTAVCRRYRVRLQECGQFVPWEQKIAARPAVADLFGSTFAFIGYNRTPDVDYVAAAGAIRDHGFGRVFYYPGRMCNYALGFKMGGDDPIWLTDHQIAGMRAVEGARLGPWGWVIERLDDGTDAVRRTYRVGADGKPVANWRIEDQQWYLVCTPYQVEETRQRLSTDMAAMDWIHFDVNAMWPGRTCFGTRHAPHGHRPMGRLEDLEWTRRLFGPATVGNRIVSSEGFADHYATHYDVGATKMMPPSQPRPACVPVPMTMLVLHDSCLHNWWELHNYNETPGWGCYDLPHGLGSVGSGRPRLKAAMDALYGCPPHLFPFGKQYAWSNVERRQTYSFIVRLADPAVQEALYAARPVAELHRRTGMLDMVAFELLSEDRLVQATTFADGTRVVANLSNELQTVDGLGPIEPQSWRVI